MCAFRGKNNTVQLLLDAKADILQSDKQERTPIEMAKSRRHKEIVDMLFEQGGKLLCEAADAGDTNLCKQLLENQLADINANSNGMTPLHYAVRRGNKSLVNNLLENNANPIANTSNGSTLFELAQASGNPELVDMFSEDESFIPYHGILHSVKDIKKKGRTALKAFNESQRTQCLNSDRLKLLITQVNTKTPEEAVYVAIGCILTRSTATTDKFRAGEWTQLPQILNEIQKEQNEVEKQQKLKRMQEIEAEIWKEIESEVSYLFKGQLEDSSDEFNYRERGSEYDDVFDEIIIRGSQSTAQEALNKLCLNNKDQHHEDPVLLDRTTSEELDLVIAEAEETVRKSRENIFGV